ncbi:MAG: selenium metabolism-associated LysR family transcriptional regulator [Thermodesulfobacteriota bacterium]
MDIRKLELFCKVVELQSFTLAGKACFLSQPTVSEHIRELEQNLDQRLLNRLSQRVTPTPAGKLLYEYACRILKIRQEAIKAIEQYGNRLAGRITIGCGTIPGTYILPELLSNFRKKYPEIKTTLQIANSHTIAVQIMDEKLDLGVIGAKWNEPGLEWTEIFTDELSLIVTPNHPWSGKKHVSCKDLLAQPFIIREPGSGTRKVISNFLKAKGYKESDLKEVAQIGSSAAVKEAVKAGCGISILSNRAVKDAVECKRLATVNVRDLKFKRPFYLVQRKKMELLPIVKIFRDYLLEQALSSNKNS